MPTGRRTCALGILVCLSCSGGWASVVKVENLTGGAVIVNSVMGGTEISVSGSASGRSLRAGDVRSVEGAGQLTVTCQPADGAAVDLHIWLPHDTVLEATTTSGAISVTGLLQVTALATEAGDVRLTMPWRLVRIAVTAPARPKAMSVEQIGDVEFNTVNRGSSWVWYPAHFHTYGSVSITSEAPDRIELVDMPIAKDSWIQAPEHALAMLGELLPAPSTNPGVQREVSLSVSVRDEKGEPVAGLRPDEFEVLEGDELQTVFTAESAEVPFNLVLLLDLSGSVSSDDGAARDVILGFLDLARPSDQFAVYTVGGSLFRAVSALTDDRERVVKAVTGIPTFTGVTPLRDSIVLTYALESLHLSECPTAIVIITDGNDNFSRVSSEELRRWVAGVPIVIYPVILPGTRMTHGMYNLSGDQERARLRLLELAEATGGRVLSLRSLDDAGDAYAELAQELRTTYTLSYLSQNRVFDGKWRSLRVRVRRPGVSVRTRPGYYAR